MSQGSVVTAFVLMLQLAKGKELRTSEKSPSTDILVDQGLAVYVKENSVNGPYITAVRLTPYGERAIETGTRYWKND